VNAAPGYSEHHTGRAIDIGASGEPPLTETFEHTAAFRWLARRGGEFGFRLSYPRTTRTASRSNRGIGAGTATTESLKGFRSQETRKLI